MKARLGRIEEHDCSATTWRLLHIFYCSFNMPATKQGNGLEVVSSCVSKPLREFTDWWPPSVSLSSLRKRRVIFSICSSPCSSMDTDHPIYSNRFFAVVIRNGKGKPLSTLFVGFATFTAANHACPCRAWQVVRVMPNNGLLNKKRCDLVERLHQQSTVSVFIAWSRRNRWSRRADSEDGMTAKLGKLEASKTRLKAMVRLQWRRGGSAL